MQKVVYAMTDHEQVSEKAGARVGRSWSGSQLREIHWVEIFLKLSTVQEKL